MPLSLESNGGVADALLTIERYGLGLDYYEGLPHRVNAVTREEVLKAAAGHLQPDKLAVVAAGPPHAEV